MNINEEKTTSGEVVSTQIVEPKKYSVKQTANIDGFIEQRQSFIEKVSAICVEGKDYHVIQGKKSLAKGGAEKIASIFSWQAEFTKDGETLEMLGANSGLVCFKCTLNNKGKFVGEGRGAASLDKNGKDPNKTIKMAQKSAYIDAVIRASGMSDFFTQDLEDMNPADIGRPQVTNSYPPTEKQYEFIKSLMEQKRVDEAWVISQGFTPLKDLTGGRTGTATELIELLKTHVPTESVTTQGQGMDFEPKVIERLSADAEQVLGELEVCFSQQEYGVLNKKISEMYAQGKFSNYDWQAIIHNAKKAVNRLK